MDTESSAPSSSSSSTSVPKMNGIQYFIHPLAITFICDHFTRMRLGGSHLPKDSPVIGLLFGTVSGSHIEITDATEAIYTMQENNTAVLNIPEIETKRQLWLEVYKEYQLIGWYSVGAVEASHMVIHQNIQGTLLDTPLFLLMDASELTGANTSASSNTEAHTGLSSGRQRLPIMLFQSEGVDDSAGTFTGTGSGSGFSPQIFVSLDYRIQSSSYENFTVDAIVKSTPLGAGVSAMEESNRTMLTSLDALGSKVDTIVECLRACQQQQQSTGSAIKSSSEYQSFLRLVHRITTQLPDAATDVDTVAMDTDRSDNMSTAAATVTEAAPTNEAMEALLVSYMASVTSNKAELMDTAEKFHIAYKRNERSELVLSGMGGMGSGRGRGFGSGARGVGLPGFML